MLVVTYSYALSLSLSLSTRILDIPILLGYEKFRRGVYSSTRLFEETNLDDYDESPAGTVEHGSVLTAGVALAETNRRIERAAATVDARGWRTTGTAAGPWYRSVRLAAPSTRSEHRTHL